MIVDHMTVGFERQHGYKARKMPAAARASIQSCEGVIGFDHVCVGITRQRVKPGLCLQLSKHTVKPRQAHMSPIAARVHQYPRNQKHRHCRQEFRQRSKCNVNNVS